jgi:hypothetical protein
MTGSLMYGSVRGIRSLLRPTHSQAVWFSNDSRVTVLLVSDPVIVNT